jgi:hypothetical protein
LENREELDVMIKFFSNMATDMIENNFVFDIENLEL